MCLLQMYATCLTLPFFCGCVFLISVPSPIFLLSFPDITQNTPFPTEEPDEGKVGFQRFLGMAQIQIVIP